MKITENDLGCWLDGNQGWRNAYRVIDRAFDYGWAPEDAAEIHRIVAHYIEERDTQRSLTLASGEIDYDSVWEVINGQRGLTDEATDYLQSLCEDGLEFIWDAGELTLMRLKDVEI